jgi:heme/copper-type cytochrome/quinol oxidase subunit 2
MPRKAVSRIRQQRRWQEMSDSTVLVAMVCVTLVSVVSIVCVTTYLKDKINYKIKANVKDVMESELAVTAEDKEPKK